MKNLILPFIKLISNNKLLSILLITFFIPFILVIIGDNICSIGNLYMFGMTDIKDFYTFWIALFGVFGITYNISQNQNRISQQDTHIDLQTKAERNARFAKGVELLGNSQESARTGGSYNLFFLAKEFPDDFKESVLNILCSHIRTITCNDDYKNTFVRTPSNEIQTLIDLLSKEGKNLFKNLRINLKASYISGVDLSGADLSGADLSGADLSKAYLSGANLSKANLSKVNLSGTYLSKANLSRANLVDANLIGANLIGTNLLGGILIGANLFEANLSEANLAEANLAMANLSEAKLSKAKLSKANLLGTNLVCANLVWTNLSETNLSEANLSEANLFEADLLGAILIRANLSKANLSKANLSGANLSGAKLTGKNINLNE